MATPQPTIHRFAPEALDKNLESARVTIEKLLRFYEATNNSFFLNKIRIILKHVKNGTTADIALKNDLTDCAVLNIAFAIGEQSLTSKEAEGLANILNSNEDGKKGKVPTLAGIGELLDPRPSIKSLPQTPESIMSLKKTLLTTGQHLDPRQTSLFITRACVRLDYTDSATAVTETLKDLDNSMASKSKAAKAWLSSPQTQVELSKELTEKETALKKHEMLFNSIGKTLKQAIDKSGDMKAKLEAVTRHNRSMAAFINQFGTKMEGLADDVENLKQLGIKESYTMLRF
ncbi:hypothetical protein BDZ45DRAFT_676067 [Acephala macrosclerotiorum]|nr:hypothetical protein BDZ45DRAFT_676067 [Acephala macrosclerotiorum]